MWGRNWKKEEKKDVSDEILGAEGGGEERARREGSGEELTLQSIGSEPGGGLLMIYL